jgi:YVTN family beta-propeller protein
MNTERADTTSRRRHRPSKQRLIAGASALAVIAAAGGLYGAYGLPGHQAPRAHGGGSIAAGTLARADAHCQLPAGTAYVAEPGFQAAGVIDAANCTVTGTEFVDDNGLPGDPFDLQFDSTSEAMAASPNGKLLYFADTGINDVVVVTANSAWKQEAVIPVGFNPGGIAFTPNGKQVWVTDTGPGTGTGSPNGVSVIDAATNKVIETLPITGSPQKVAFSPNGDLAYITTQSGLEVIDTATYSLVAQVPGLDQPHGVAVSPNGAYVYVTDSGDSRLSVIDASSNQVVASIPVGELPWAVTVSPDGQTAYVADTDSNEVSVIDTATNKVVQSYEVRDDPASMTLSDNGKYLWVSATESGDIDVFSTATGRLLAPIAGGSGIEPTDIAVIPSS